MPAFTSRFRAGMCDKSRKTVLHDFWKISSQKRYLTAALMSHQSSEQMQTSCTDDNAGHAVDSDPLLPRATLVPPTPSASRCQQVQREVAKVPRSSQDADSESASPGRARTPPRSFVARAYTHMHLDSFQESGLSSRVWIWASSPGH